MTDKEIEKYIDGGVQLLQRKECLSSNLIDFFLIYTIAFCNNYINIESWEASEVNLYNLKSEAKSKLNKFLFDKLDESNKEIVDYIEWIKLNSPKYIKEDILGSIYILTLEKEKRKRLGEHYTRYDVIELITEKWSFSGLHEKKIIDPACGSGNFLINILSQTFANNPIEKRKRIIENIENMNFLIGVDIQELPCIITKLRMLMEIVYYNNEIDPLLKYPVFQLDSLLSENPILEDNFYDLVITNPPYLRYQLIDVNKRSLLKKLYYAAVGRFDLYTLFIEKGIKLAKENGQVIILCSDKFMGADYGIGIKEYIEKNAKLISVIDLSTIYPFRAAVLSAVYQFDKVKNKKPENALWLKPFPCDDKMSTNVQGEVIIGNEWRYSNKKSEEILNKIVSNSNVLLGDITLSISIGLQTTADKVFSKFMTYDFVKKNNFESQLVFPLLRGRNLKKWAYEWEGNNNKDTFVLYPYTFENNKTIPIILSDFPNVSSYLHKYKKELEGRSYFQGKSNKQWFEHWTPHSFNFFNEIKILTPDIASECMFSLDVQGFFYNGTAYSIKLKKDYSVDDYKYLLGLLNSKVIEFFHKKINTTHLESDKYRFRPSVLKKYPLVMLNKDDERYREIVSLVNEILNGVREKDLIEKEINEIVFRIYGLKKKEIEDL